MQQFNGIAEKLVRAKENIFDLNAEIEGFFNESEYPFLPEHDHELLLKAIEYHKNLFIPPRFAVLAGEIIHHLRSCFDHLVWHFSTGPQKNNMPVEFPVFAEKPIKKDTLARFEGKIQRITNPQTVDLIKGLQPYNSANPFDDPLWIIHDFDIVDKHRELIICAGTASRVYPVEMKGIVESYQQEHPHLDPAKIARHFKNHGSAQPCISFRNFGGRKIEPIIRGLTQLFDHTINVVKRFEIL